MAEASSTSKYLAEFVGTFALVFTVGCHITDAAGSAFNVISIASVLMVMIYSLGGISGGHFNPAVSFAIALNGDAGFGWADFGIYSLVQIFGGIAAGFSYVGLHAGKTVNLSPNGTVGGHDLAWNGAMAAFLVEVMYTFMLTFTVLNVACAKRSQPNEYFGLAIAFTVVAGGYGGGQISGGCFNPAVALGIDLASAWVGFGHALHYVVAELLGGALANGLYRVVHPEEFGGSSEPSTASKLTSEFLGTFFLVFTVGMNVFPSAGKAVPAAAVFSIASSLMCMIYALGNVSGGHFNPAVTLAILMSGRGKTNVGEAAMYIPTQLLGGVCAGVLAGSVCGFGAAIGAGAGFNWGQLFIAEAFFTFVLCFTVLCVATTRSALAHFFALAIGFCVIVGGYAVGDISGGHFNPAVSMGLDASGALFAGGVNFWRCFVYGGMQCVGGAAAAGVFAVTHATEFAKTQKKDIEYGTL